MKIGSTISGLLLMLVSIASYSQDTTSTNLLYKVSSDFPAKISKKVSSLNEQIDKKSEKALRQMQKQEAKMMRRLQKIDSLAASNIFFNADEKYKQLEQKLKVPGKLTQYIPHLDSIAASLNFLSQNNQYISQAKEVQQKLKDAVSKMKELESRFQKAEDIRQFLKERKQFLKEQLEKFGFAKQLKKLNKQVYYYSEQITEYKAILKDSKKAERKALELLSKTKVFQDFMRKNSMLASLFRMPGDFNDPSYIASLAGLQTRVQVNNLIQQQIASGGPNAQAQFQQNVQGAQAQLNQLKNKIAQYGSSSSDDIMPEGFKKNDQKTKSFLKRLEYGTNIQSQRASYFFPVTSDLGFSLGYKLNDKSVIGIGASYKLGWGRGWNNISITNQGVGLRSFIDWKVKGSFWVSGGYEQNYKTAFSDFNQLRERNAWQTSGLIGISKMISLKTKLFKKTKLQLLWDFMSYQQIPRTQPVVFRIGYNIK